MMNIKFSILLMAPLFCSYFFMEQINEGFVCLFDNYSSSQNYSLNDYLFIYQKNNTHLSYLNQNNLNKNLCFYEKLFSISSQYKTCNHARLLSQYFNKSSQDYYNVFNHIYHDYGNYKQPFWSSIFTLNNWDNLDNHKHYSDYNNTYMNPSTMMVPYNIQNIKKVNIQHFLKNQTETILDYLFMAKIKYDEHVFDIGTPELMSLYSTLYRKIIQNNNQDDYIVISNLILEEMIMSNKHLVIDSNIHNKQLVYSFLSLHQNIMVYLLSFPFQQYTTLLYKSLQHYDTNDINVIYHIIQNYNHDINCIIIHKLKCLFTHIYDISNTRNEQLYKETYDILQQIYTHNTYSSRISHFIFTSSKQSGELFIMPLLGITEKLMMFTFQSYSHTCFGLFMCTYLSCLVYFFAKALGFYIHLLFQICSNVLNKSQVYIYIFSHNHILSRKLLPFDNDSYKTRQIQNT